MSSSSRSATGWGVAARKAEQSLATRRLGHHYQVRLLIKQGSEALGESGMVINQQQAVQPGKGNANGWVIK